MKTFYLATAETLLKAFFVPVTFHLRKQKNTDRYRKKKISLTASQPSPIPFCTVEYSWLFPFCSSSCVHALSPESFQVIRDSHLLEKQSGLGLILKRILLTGQNATSMPTGKRKKKKGSLCSAAVIQNHSSIQ